ncbi:MAG: preprotein translocase subunit SecG [bacterium]
MQRSEGGALGIGGGGGGMMSGRGAADFLTRSTSILGGLFIFGALGLSMFSIHGDTEEDLARELTGEDPEAAIAIDSGEASSDDLLESLDFGTDTPVQPETEDLSTEAPIEDDPAAADQNGSEANADSDSNENSENSPQ